MRLLAAVVACAALACVLVVSTGVFTSSQSVVLDQDDYRYLLKRSKQVLHSGGNQPDWGNQRFLANAEKEQLDYVHAKNKVAERLGKQAQIDAGKLFSKWTDPYKGTIYEKYDKKPSSSLYKAPTTQLYESPKAKSPTQVYASKERAAFKKAQQAKAACNGQKGCEQVLNQVMGLFKN